MKKKIKIKRPGPGRPKGTTPLTMLGSINDRALRLKPGEFFLEPMLPGQRLSNMRKSITRLMAAVPQGHWTVEVGFGHVPTEAEPFKFYKFLRLPDKSEAESVGVKKVVRHESGDDLL